MWSEEGRYNSVWMSRVLAGLNDAGLSMSDNLKALGIDPQGEFLTRHEAISSLASAGMISRDEALRLLPSKIQPGTVALYARALMLGEDLGSALAWAGRFTATITPSVQSRLTVEGDRAIITLSLDGPDRQRSALVEDYMVVVYFCLYCHFVGRRIPLRGVTSPLDPHPLVGAMHPMVRCPVSAGAETRLIFPAACLDWPRRMPMVLDTLPDAFNWYGAKLPFRRPFQYVDAPVDEDLLALEEKLYLSRPGDPAAAAEMRGELARSRVRRRPRNQLISAMAVELLVTTSFPVVEIAAMLGYADASSFRRFMRSEVGQAPSDIREAWKYETFSTTQAEMETWYSLTSDFGIAR
jgi:hypothetical protein